VLKLSFALIVIAPFAAVQAGCGGGLAKGDASTGGDAQVDQGPSGSFITADVDGQTIRAAMASACGTGGVMDGQIWATVAMATLGLSWTLHMDNRVGTTDCPSAFVELADNFGDAPPGLISNVPDASCSVTVTAAAPAIGDVLEGTFIATVPTVPPAFPAAVHQVSNGAFRVTRDRQ
jgi:hypothetical protein